MEESIRVIAWDGYRLAVKHFCPAKPNGSIALINAATGVKQSYYRDFATYLATKGFHVYTFDYRGIGESRQADLKDVKADMKDWSILDLDAVIGHISSIHSHFRLVIIGHSVGGQLIGMSRLSVKADAFVMIGSQTPYWRLYNGLWTQTKLFFFWYLMIPVFSRAAGYFPASRLKMFEDLPRNVALQWARWAKSKDYVFKDHPYLKESFERLEQRTLVISFEDDDLAPKKAVLDLLRFYKRLKVDHWHFHPEDMLLKHVGHFGFFRKKMEPILWNDTLRWINAALTASRNKAA